MNEESLHIEYQIRRQEILQWDTTCLQTLAFLGAFTGIIYGFTGVKEYPYLIVGISLIWFIGFLYIAEKRFQIRKSAQYIKEELESKVVGFKWQTWLGSEKNQQNTLQGLHWNPFKKVNKETSYLRFSPIKIEMWLTFFVIQLNTAFLASLKTDTITKIVLLGISFLLLLYFVSVMYRINAVYKKARLETDFSQR